MNISKIIKIRPAGRHILTIGRDLIQDKYAAIVELVKNSYDADSPDINLEFRAASDKRTYSIKIIDHGHGMSRDTVINRWMVPSTDDKFRRQKSPLGRIMQGRKGIGRYAVSILGNDLLLETITSEGQKTTAYIEWKIFETAQYLDDVEIIVETSTVSQLHGTILTVTGDLGPRTEWNQSQFDKLRFELKKLVSPIVIDESKNSTNDYFQIDLSIKGFPEVRDIEEIVEPYPIFDSFDYRIMGKINIDGKGSLTYSMQKAGNAPEEKINFNLNSPTGCGELICDIRVYDREKQAIESLISRVKDKSGYFLDSLQARQLLNDYNGIGVYLNGFRIRPLGDADFDWLKLNERRIQNPSLRIGSNQVIGYVLIEGEEHSGLIEKSARDGLRGNAAYEQLKEITKNVIAKLEEKRFDYRKKAGLSRGNQRVEQQLEKLFSSDELENGIRLKLSKNGIEKKAADEIIDMISKETEDKNKLAKEISQTVAIYQGQATLGKIINVVLHEGRKPINYFKNQIPNMKYWYDLFLSTGDAEKLDYLIPIVNGIEQNSDILVRLFGRLDPLAAGKRTAKKLLELKKTVEQVFSIFSEELKKNKISVEICGPAEFKFLSWPQDIYAIFTNLVDNSIYWIVEKNSEKREIKVEISTKGNMLLSIDYQDTGPGIDPNLIASEIIFEPEFSTKPNGMGLGLAIAGEAASRNGLELKAFESETGAHFKLQPKEELRQ